jgi:hypothetical protein
MPLPQDEYSRCRNQTSGKLSDVELRARFLSAVPIVVNRYTLWLSLQSTGSAHVCSGTRRQFDPMLPRRPHWSMLGIQSATGGNRPDSLRWSGPMTTAQVYWYFVCRKRQPNSHHQKNYMPWSEKRKCPRKQRPPWLRLRWVDTLKCFPLVHLSPLRRPIRSP